MTQRRMAGMKSVTSSLIKKLSGSLESSATEPAVDMTAGRPRGVGIKPRLGPYCEARREAGASLIGEKLGLIELSQNAPCVSVSKPVEELDPE